MNKELFEYEDFNRYKTKILDILKKEGRDYKGIIIPLRGGFYLGDYIARQLNLERFYINISSYNNNKQEDFHIEFEPEIDGGRYLIVDDILDTGNTIKKIREIYFDFIFDAAVLVTKKEEKGLIYGKKVEKETWIDFFWEK